MSLENLNTNQIVEFYLHLYRVAVNREVAYGSDTHQAAETMYDSCLRAFDLTQEDVKDLAMIDIESCHELAEQMDFNSEAFGSTPLNLRDPNKVNLFLVFFYRATFANLVKDFPVALDLLAGVLHQTGLSTTQAMELAKADMDACVRVCAPCFNPLELN